MKNQLRGWFTAVIVALVAANTVAPVVLGLPKDDPSIDDDPIIDDDPDDILPTPPGDPDRDCTGATKTFTLMLTALLKTFICDAGVEHLSGCPRNYRTIAEQIIDDDLAVPLE